MKNKEALITYLKYGDINNTNNWKTVVCYYDCITEVYDTEDELITSGEAICIIETVTTEKE